MRRYKLVGWLRSVNVPVIIFIAGSTGTGKSTVATELAYHLGIHNITSTDIIREAMRTIISSEVVPGLHDHSFKGIALGGEQLSNPRERVLAGFRQQAAQVAVGVRAVIRRALRENVHLIIEGTHLLPPFEDLVPLGTPCHIAGFVLAVNKEERHQARFPQRAKRATLRDPTPYLEAFQSVRWIHDDLLALADEHGTISFNNKAINSTLSGAIDYLSKSFPVEGGDKPKTIPKAIIPAPKRPTLLLILDGLADEPNPLLSGKTPLEAACTPTIDKLAGGGGQGLIHTGPASGALPETDDGFKALLGNVHTQAAGLGRGLIEALGCGINLPAGAILFRGNLATIHNDGLISDRRAGRIREGATELLSSLKSIPLGSGISGNIYAGKEHRVIVMLQGPRLSADVCDTDPGSDAVNMTPISATPTVDSPEALRTALALNKLIKLVGNHLEKHPINIQRAKRGLPPANTIITRGAASVAQAPNQRYEDSPFAMVSGCTTSLGLARIYGYLPVTTSQMTGNLDTDIPHKFDTASMLFSDHSLVAIHFKGTDIAAHDRMPLEKCTYIERVDKSLGDFLNKHPDMRIAITADHGTSSKTGHHTNQPVPLLVADWDPENDSTFFNEDTAEQGALGLLGPGELNAILCGES
jgi:2,3-bisphosphoglycerate-independent phosphoglycerate mutase